MLGPTRVDGRPFFVRQMKNMKASIPVEWLIDAKICGGLMARAYARAGDAAAICGYCGKSPVPDEAFVKWAEAYGNQTEQDHACLVQAINTKNPRDSGSVAAASLSACSPRELQVRQIREERISL